MNQKKRKEGEKNYTTKLENLDIRMKPPEEEISREQKLKFKKKEREHAVMRFVMIFVINVIVFLVLFLIAYFWDDILIEILP